MANEVVYLAHPVSGDVLGNMKRARRWLRWLMENEPDTAFCVPWLPLLDVCDDASDAERARCLRDDINIAGRCDGIVLCGGRVSNGMSLELGAVVASGGWVVDLTRLGKDPPIDEVVGANPLQMSQRVMYALSDPMLRPRRVTGY